MTAPALNGQFDIISNNTTLTDRYNTVIYYLQLNQFMMRTCVKIYINRISLEYRSALGLWEHRETYNAMDIGNIYINKGRAWANIGAHKLNSNEKLFEINGIHNDQAEELKDALDKIISYRYQVSTAQNIQNNMI